jgi:hypothetical protein
MHRDPLLILWTRRELARLARESRAPAPRVTDADVSAALEEAEALLAERGGVPVRMRRRGGRPVRYARTIGEVKSHPDHAALHDGLLRGNDRGEVPPDHSGIYADWLADHGLSAHAEVVRGSRVTQWYPPGFSRKPVDGSRYDIYDSVTKPGMHAITLQFSHAGGGGSTLSHHTHRLTTEEAVRLTRGLRFEGASPTSLVHPQFRHDDLAEPEAGAPPARMRRRGRPLRYAVDPHFELKEVHPDFRPDGVAPRLGRALTHLTRTLDPEHPAHDLATGLLAFGPDHGRFVHLGHALEADGHPMAGAYNWDRIHQGMELDRKVLGAVRAHPDRRFPLREAQQWHSNQPGGDPAWVHSYADAGMARDFIDGMRHNTPWALEVLAPHLPEGEDGTQQERAERDGIIDSLRRIHAQRSEHAHQLRGAGLPPFATEPTLRYGSEVAAHRYARPARPLRYASADLITDDDGADPELGTPTAPGVPAADALRRAGATRKWLSAAAKVSKPGARPPLDPALFKALESAFNIDDKRVKSVAAAAILGLSPGGSMGLADHVRRDAAVPPSDYDPLDPGGRAPAASPDAYAQLGRLLKSRGHHLAGALNWDRVGKGVVLDHLVEGYLAKNGVDPKHAHKLALNKGNTRVSEGYRKANPNFYETLPGAHVNGKQQAFLKAFLSAARAEAPRATLDDVGKAFVRAAMRAHTPHGPGTAGLKPDEARKAPPPELSKGHLRRYRRRPLDPAARQAVKYTRGKPLRYARIDAMNSNPEHVKLMDGFAERAAKGNELNGRYLITDLSGPSALADWLRDHGMPAHADAIGHHMKEGDALHPGGFYRPGPGDRPLPDGRSRYGVSTHGREAVLRLEMAHRGGVFGWHMYFPRESLPAMTRGLRAEGAWPEPDTDDEFRHDDLPDLPHAITYTAGAGGNWTHHHRDGRGLRFGSPEEAMDWWHNNYRGEDFFTGNEAHPRVVDAESAGDSGPN